MGIIISTPEKKGLLVLVRIPLLLHCCCIMNTIAVNAVNVNIRYVLVAQERYDKEPIPRPPAAAWYQSR